MNVMPMLRLATPLHVSEDFAEQGFVHLHAYFDPDRLRAFEQAIVDLYSMQANKIADVWANKRDAGLLSILGSMEVSDKAALYQVQKLFPSSQRLRALFDDDFVNLCAGLIGGNPDTTLIDGPGVLPVRPDTDRLRYKWHTEAHYYPKRRKFLNVWFPLYGDRSRDNGAMSILPGSHNRIWESCEFSEYRGYTTDSKDKDHAFYQYEIPENFLTQYAEHWCESKRGDLILTHRNMVHRSNPNTTQDYAFAAIVRVWDPSEDLTLSGDVGVKPWTGNDLGRANLQVEA